MPAIKLRYTLIFIVILISCLIWTAPAWLMAKLANTASNETIILENTSGRFLKGNATAINYRRDRNTIQRFENISWHWVPTQLLKGNLAFRIIITDRQITADGIMGAGFTGHAINEFHANISAESIGNLFPEASTLSPRGDLDIKIPSLKINPFKIEEPASIHWKNAGVTISNVSPLGDYMFNLTPQKDGIDVKLQTIKGPLRMNGNGSYNEKTGGRIDGEAQGGPELTPVLRLMGIPHDGKVDFVFTIPPLV